MHDRAVVVSTGDELVLGQMLDTNSRAISTRLMDAGIRVVEHVTLGDDRAALSAALRRAAASVPLVIVTGGLGPTLDDVTRDALADATGDSLVEDAGTLRTLEELMARRGRPLTAAVRTQALRPSRAACLPNPVGTAPGLAGVIAPASGPSCDVICLPGPPSEWTAMWEASVRPRLRPAPGSATSTRLLHLCGIGESDAAARLGSLMERGREPTVGITASGGVLTVRARAVGTDAAAKLAAVADEVRRLLGAHIFGEGTDTLPSAAVRLLRNRGETLAVAESCTGGGLGAAITSVSGSSSVFLGGVISYANEVKRGVLGVSEADLREHGAVSGQVARSMAEGAARVCGAHHALAVTGIAGPDGGSEAKPVGTVWIAHAWQSAAKVFESDVRRFLIPGSRADVRDRSATAALSMLVMRLAAAATSVPGPAHPPPLLWETTAGR